MCSGKFRLTILILRIITRVQGCNVFGKELIVASTVREIQLFCTNLMLTVDVASGLLTQLALLNREKLLPASFTGSVELLELLALLLLVALL